jgi:hypothetical protein
LLICCHACPLSSAPGNHTRLLGDVCNASETKNIDQIALTQTEVTQLC